VTSTLAATQGVGGEVAEDEDGHFVPLVGCLILHLD
jgi:hypothetical protein